MNFIITNEFWDKLPHWWIEREFFGDEPVYKIAKSFNMRHRATMWDILTLAGVFPSKSQARKNWKGEVEIPWGFNQWTVGKQRTVITVWRPMPDPTFNTSVSPTQAGLVVRNRPWFHGSFFFRVSKTPSNT